MTWTRAHTAAPEWGRWCTGGLARLQVSTVLIFVHSFDGVRHAGLRGCVEWWCSRSQAVRDLRWLCSALSAPMQSFLHSLHAHALTRRSTQRDRQRQRSAEAQHATRATPPPEHIRAGW